MKRVRIWLLVLAAASLPGVNRAAAAQIRFRYVPVDDRGTTKLQAYPGLGSAGEQVRYFGAVREPYSEPPRPSHMVTFLHPYSGRNITVPVSFGNGTPITGYRRDRISFSYGDFVIEALFLQDGSVEMIYNAGFLRSFQPQSPARP